MLHPETFSTHLHINAFFFFTVSVKALYCACLGYIVSLPTLNCSHTSLQIVTENSCGYAYICSVGVEKYV